jgi:glutamate formiminotransferase / 5-formyltetrahydrofolate cyclo-ligase
MAIVMCVPNISEGRNSATVEAVAEAVRGTADVALLDYSSDPNHNRSVLTFLGEPEAVLRAAQAMTKVALELIDMRGHKGSHPRVGAVDVVPFVPVRGLETAAAVEIARRFGRYVGTLGVPVYYYEEAATRPERCNLADIRKGEYEGLPEKLRDPDWQPDEGPCVFNPRAGALVTGARFPLVAFNVNLRTTDLTIAQRIAKAIRHINGGYRYVRAIGLALEERSMVQVSINLTNYTRTPLPRVLETIRSEAARYGVAVAGTELIGPVPLGALEEVVYHYLQAHEFSLDQIIETALIREK